MPFWVKLAPVRRHDRSASSSPTSSTSARRRRRSASPQQHRVLYQFLLNKWYFDELYDFLFVRPAKRARPLPVEAATAGHRRPRARRRLGARHRRHRPRRPAADRLPLSLRLRDADRHRRARHLDDVRGAHSDDRLANPLHGHLPAAGRRRCSSCSSADERRRTRRRNILQHRAADDGRHLRRLARPDLVRLRHPNPASSSSRSIDWLGFRHLLPAWASTASPCCSSS